MLTGSVWLIGLRWAVRLTGVISTLVLARLLSPSDFGVVAIAMIVVGMFEVLSWNGQELAIIRHTTAIPDHYNTAWTISALIGVVIAAGIILVAPLTKNYFHDDRAIAVMRWLAIRPLLSGLENVGTVDFQRDLRFDRVFGYNFYAKVIAFFVTITAAALLRNYWALVIGTLTGQSARTILSYLLHPYRPAFSLSKRVEIWSFSIWSFTRAVGSYFITQIDVIAVGGTNGSAAMGRYTVAKDVASSPVDELNEPVSAVLFPVMARYQSDPVQLRNLYLRTLGWAAIIGASAGPGVMMVAQDMIRLILGAKWYDTIPLIGWLALTAGASALTNSSYTVLDILGIPHVGARLQWIRVLLLAALLLPIAWFSHSLMAIAQARLAVSLIFIPTLLLSVGVYVSVSWKQYLAVLWRPILAGFVMCAVLYGINFVVPPLAPLRLAIDVFLGAVIFGLALLALWSWSGRPASPERDILTLYEGLRARLVLTRDRGSKRAQ